MTEVIDVIAKLTQLVEGAGDGTDADLRRQAVAGLSAEDIETVLHPQFAASGEGAAGADSASASPDGGAGATGLGASPGAAVGIVARDADAAADAAAEGESVILVMEETSPADVHGMAEAAGILTTRGGLASHAAVVARGWGIPAVVGVEAIELTDTGFRIGDVEVAIGDTLAIDGTTGAVTLGARELSATETPESLVTLLEWSDEIVDRTTLVRANADNAADAQVARDFGAQGIGLCRSEHQFLGDRLPLVQRAILAADAVEEAEALEALGAQQEQDFVELFEVMDGLPVTVRLLDPPLHEFLPDLETLAREEAEGTLTPERKQLAAAAREWSEHNPMLGTRGVRLAMLRPDLYRMQIRSILRAMALRRTAGGKPIVEILVPLVVTVAEFVEVKNWVAEIAQAEGVVAQLVTVGVMIETPRAALIAEDLAVEADFLSFGTNDLTQMVFGFSRDDVEAKLMGTYLERGLLAENPFAHLDIDGVGDLVRQAAEGARWAKESIKVGVCGEHGGDPASIAFFSEIGLDYVSCSPFRVPVARLALAHASQAED